jgi:hypothetical protein
MVNYSHKIVKRKKGEADASPLRSTFSQRAGAAGGGKAFLLAKLVPLLARTGPGQVKSPQPLRPTTATP